MNNENKKTNNISFSWDLHYKCNYRCPYCWWHGRWQNSFKLSRVLPVNELMHYWTKVYEKYGPVHIELLGGEPFIYPHFKELIIELSKLHTLGITTNLSVDLDDCINSLDFNRVKIIPTFHPTFADFEKFIKKAKLLKEKAFSTNVYYLAYPPQIKFINFYREKFSKENVELKVMTFWGNYNGIDYPAGYNPQELAAIETSLAKRSGESYQLSPKNDFKGKFCNAGRYYGVIHSDGTVIRCGGSDLNEVIGNFFDDHFKLLDEPLPCRAEHCKCNEWAFLLDK